MKGLLFLADDLVLRFGGATLSSLVTRPKCAGLRVSTLFCDFDGMPTLPISMKQKQCRLSLKYNWDDPTSLDLL